MTPELELEQERRQGDPGEVSTVLQSLWKA